MYLRVIHVVIFCKISIQESIKMVLFFKLLFLTMSFLVVSSNSYKTDDKTISQIALKTRPSELTVESNIISESQVKYYNSQENPNNAKIRLQTEQDILIYNLWQLFKKAGNNLSSKPSNPQLFTILINLLTSKNAPSAKSINTTDKRPGVVSFSEEIPASTEATTSRAIPASTRPISTTEAIATTRSISTTTEAKTTITIPVSTTTEAIATTSKTTTTTEEYFDDDDDTARPIKFIDTKAYDFGILSRKMPKVEHGSIQYTNTSAS